MLGGKKIDDDGSDGTKENANVSFLFDSTVAFRLSRE